MNPFYSQGILWIAIVCLAVLFLVYFKQKSSLILNFVQRGIIGFVVITGFNKLFAYLAVPLFVGINVWTLLTSAILGIPGVVMLFCLSFF